MITFEVVGPYAVALENELTMLIQEATGESPTNVHPGRIRTRSSPVEVVSLILSIPGAVLATMELLERRRAPAQRLISRAKALFERDGTRIFVESRSAQRLPLDEIEPDAILKVLEVSEPGEGRS